MWRYIAVLIAFVAVCGFAYRTGSKVAIGKCDAEKLALQTIINKKSEADNAIDNKVDSMPDAAVEHSLQKWYRD